MAAITMTQGEIDRLFVGLRKPDIGLFNKWVSYLLQLNGDTGGIQDVTYAELGALIGAAALEPAQYYRITDFASLIDIPNEPGGLQSQGPVEPLIVLATGTATLDPVALSQDNPTDLIEYDFASADLGADKGRITRRVITAQNSEAPFDVRVAEFIRWETSPGSGIFTVIFDNGGASQLAPAFLIGGAGSDASEITIRPFQLTGSAPLSPNIICETGCAQIEFGLRCINMTIRDSNTRLSFGDSCNMLTTGSTCNDISSGDQFTASSIGDTCQFITINKDVDTLTIGDTCENIRVGSQSSTNAIGNNCNNIILGADNSDNTLGDFNTQITFADRVFSMGLGASCSNIRVGDLSNSTTIGDSCSEITVGFSSSAHTIGISCSNLKIGDLTGSLNFDTLCDNIHVGSNVTSESYTARTFFRREELTYGESYFKYNFGTDGGAQGTINLANIPTLSTIEYAIIQASTSIAAGAGCMIQFGVATDDAAGLLPATIFSNAIFNSGVWQNLTPLWMDATFTNQSTAIRNIIMVITMANITNGVLNFKMRYTKDF